MSNRNNYDNADEVRARFTVWMELTLKNARNQYYRKQEPKFTTISIEELPIELQADPVNPYTKIEHSADAFEFEEEKLAKAFYKLPLMRREVLRLLFVRELSPEEIAHTLNCSVDYVYKQKYRALKKLRIILEED